MLPNKNMISLDTNSRMPIYIQLTNGIIKAILNNSLRGGMKLPGSRTLAEHFGIHRKTVTSAYEELEAQGWLTTIPAIGSFVSKELPLTEVRKFSAANRPLPSSAKQTLFPLKKTIVDTVHQFTPNFKNLKYRFDDGLPDLRLSPAKALGKQYKSLLNGNRAHEKLNYTSDLWGNVHLREQLVKHLFETRSIQVATENIMIVRGSIMGFYLFFQAVLAAEDFVIVGDTNYFSANQTILKAGGKIISVPVDEHGIVVDEVEKICKKKKIRAIYVVPHHHHPTTVTLTPERRMRLLQLAEQYKFAIIEDDYDYDFHYASSPVLPLASADNLGMVTYVGTFSKSIAPAFRIGFVVAPENLIQEMALLRRFIDRQGDVMLERAIGLMLEEGEVRRHLRKVLKIYHQRRDYFCSLLEKELGNFVRFQIPEGGLAVWVIFDSKIDMTKLSALAAAKGLYIADSKKYNPEGEERNATRMGFASMTEKETKAAVKILKSVIPFSFLKI